MSSDLFPLYLFIYFLKKFIYDRIFYLRLPMINIVTLCQFSLVLFELWLLIVFIPGHLFLEFFCCLVRLGGHLLETWVSRRLMMFFRFSAILVIIIDLISEASFIAILFCNSLW